MKLDGDRAKQLAEKIKKKEIEDGRKGVLAELRKAVGEVDEDSVVGVKVVGNEKKHLKVSLRLSLIHISEPTRQEASRMPSSA